jgi:hypothetical protein
LFDLSVELEVQPFMRRVAPQLAEERNTTMRFLCLYKPGKPECPPTQQEMVDMGKLIAEAMKAGWLIATEGCLPSAVGARVRLSDGKFMVTDGPFTETKEVVGGFAIIQASSKQEAIEHTKYFLQVAGGGETEIRQLYEAPAAASGKPWSREHGEGRHGVALRLAASALDALALI